MFFVSHDRYFLNKAADKIYELTPNGINRYEGNYDDYLEKSAVAANTAAASAAGKESDASAALTYEQEKRRRADIKNKTKKLENAEKLIEETEKAVEELNKKLEECGSDYDKISGIYAEIEEKNRLLSQTYELWNSLTEELEELRQTE